MFHNGEKINKDKLFYNGEKINKDNLSNFLLDLGEKGIIPYNKYQEEEKIFNCQDLQTLKLQL